MFGTLTRDNSTQASYIVQVMDPPFLTDRNTRTPHLACVPCRSKKLKCSGEKTGCQRCRLKNLPCVFPDQPASRSTRKQRSKRSESAVSEPSDPPDNGSATRRSSPLESRNQEILPPSQTPVGEEKPDGDAFLDLSDFYSTGLSSTPDLGDISGLEVPLDPNAALPASSPSTFLDAGCLDYRPRLLDGYQDPHKLNSPLLPTSIDLDTESPPVFSALGHTPLSPSASCECASLALALYERTQILYNRLDATAQSTTRDYHMRDTLQRSKELIHQCDYLVECALCRKQSHFAMILLSVSHQLILCLERQCTTANHHLLTDWHPEPTTQGLPGTLSRKPHRWGCFQGSSLDLGTQKPPSSASSLPDSPNGLGSEDWEDEIQVLKTLLKLRMRATAKLLGKLQTIIDVGGWREHRELLGRVSALYQAVVGSINLLGVKK